MHLIPVIETVLLVVKLSTFNGWEPLPIVVEVRHVEAAGEVCISLAPAADAEVEGGGQLSCWTRSARSPKVVRRTWVMSAGQYTLRAWVRGKLVGAKTGIRVLTSEERQW